MIENIKESAAELELMDNIREGSETIPRGSTYENGESNNCFSYGSATVPNVNDEGCEIVRNKRFNCFLEKAKNIVRKQKVSSL